MVTPQPTMMDAVNMPGDQCDEYEGWIAIEAEQHPKANLPLDMAIKGRAELKRVMDAAGYEVTI